MKIAVVGCGAVGSFYGGKLAYAGHEAHFLLRTDYEAVRRKGLFVRRSQGAFHIRPMCSSSPEQVCICDLVLAAPQTTATCSLQTPSPSLADSQTALLSVHS